MTRKNLAVIIFFILVGTLFIILNNKVSNFAKISYASPTLDQGILKIDDGEPGIVYDQLSLPVFANKKFNGSDLTLGSVLAQTNSYTRYYITYKSGDLTISGILNIPQGTGPFPVLFLNHGFIDPDVYTNGRGLKREQDYLASRGYAVLHSDYRNHADSDETIDDSLNFRLGYTEDIINAVLAVKNSDIPELDKQKFGMLGHSMGGGIAQNIMVTQPDLLNAIVLFAPVSTNYVDSYRKWVEERVEVAEKIELQYGDPVDNVDFWANLSPVNFLDNVTVPIMLHHGTNDESVPLDWSKTTVSALKNEGKEITFYIYEGEKHEFINQWSLVMKRTVDFFDQYLKY